MMKAEELRIGNWVEYKGKFYQVYSLASQFIELDTMEFGYGVVEFNDVNPIHLTEEILLKCGFSNYHYGWTGWFYNESNIVIRKTPDNFYALLDLRNEDFDHSLLTEIKHLHQLQNLYFALTGQELKIEL